MKVRLRLLAMVFASALSVSPLLLAAEPAKVAVQLSKDHVDFLVGDDLVGRYHIGPEIAKPYLWPVHGPGGVRMTRDWPMAKGQAGESTDHVHQKSVWFCHGDIIPEGLSLKAKIKDVDGIDFWSEGSGHGKIVCLQVGETKLDKGHALLPTDNEWRTGDGEKVMEEKRTIHLYDLGNQVRLFVFDIDLHASVYPITFGDTKEGSFGIRINDAIREEITINKKRTKGPGQLENADGKVGEKDCWGRISAWCDYSGPLESKTVGLAILSDPANPYPACWHSRGYGLMAANPFGRARSGFPEVKGRTDLVKLARGEHLKLRYGLLIHPGDAKEGKVREYYEQFIHLKD